MLDLKTFGDGLRRGYVDPRIFFDEDIYRLELDRVFRRTWQLVAHESQLKEPGDYITNFMGEDGVLVVRDRSGVVRVFLNRCRHRGNEVCPYDRGSAKAFACSYHGWTYGIDGTLLDVPFFEASYDGVLDFADWGLIEVPSVASYADLIFASWDAEGTLDSYLGEMRTYLDWAIGREFAGGMEVIPGTQSHTLSGNWKLIAENFAGDLYHPWSSHLGSLMVKDPRTEDPGTFDNRHLAWFHANTGSDGHPTHGLIGGQLYGDAEAYDRYIAKQLDDDAVDYVDERYRKLREAKPDPRIYPGNFLVGNVFPNASFITRGTVVNQTGIQIWHPRGPRAMEGWQWVLVEKNAPASLKRFAALDLIRTQSPSGIVEPDDYENFMRMTRAAGSPASLRYPLNYQMGMGVTPPEDYTAKHLDELPGDTAFGYSEFNQVALYRYWAQLMEQA